MAVTQTPHSTSLIIEVKSGTDKAGLPTYSKKSFSNVRNDASAENVVAVADAIKGILAEGTRDYFLDKTSKLENV